MQISWITLDKQIDFHFVKTFWSQKPNLEVSTWLGLFRALSTYNVCLIIDSAYEYGRAITGSSFNYMAPSNNR